MEQFALFMFYVVDKNYTPIVLRVVCLWLCLFSIWLDTFGYRKAKTKIEISMHFKLFLSHSTLRCVFRTTWLAVLCGRVFSILWIFFLFTFSELFDKFGDDCWKIGWFIFEETHNFKFPTLICLIDLFTFGWLCMHVCVCFCMYVAAVTFFIIFIEYSFDLFACAYTFYHSNRIKVSRASSFSLFVRFRLVCRCFVR